MATQETVIAYFLAINVQSDTAKQTKNHDHTLAGYYLRVRVCLTQVFMLYLSFTGKVTKYKFTVTFQ